MTLRFHSRYLRLVGTTALLSFATSAAAEEAKPVEKAPISTLLRDTSALVTWLEKHHADVMVADAKVDQARADVGASKLPPNPTVDASVNNLTVGQRNPNNLAYGDTLNFNFGVSQTFEIGKRGPRVRAAELRVESAKKAREATLTDKVGDARLALARVAYLKARLAILEESVAAAKRAADIEKARLENGALAGVDYDRLTLDNISLESDLARARADYAGALSACQASVFTTCDADTTKIDDLDTSAPVPAAPEPQRVSDRADVASLRLEGSASTEDATLARNKAIPDPNVRVGFTHDNLTVAGNQGNAFQVTLTVPIPVFDHGQHAAAKAEAHAREVEHAAQSIEVGARSSLDGLWTRKATLEGIVQTLATTAVPKSSGVLAITSQAFDKGQMSLTDLLLARRTHIGLLLNQADARFDYFSVRNDIRRALGLDEQGDSKTGSASGPLDSKTGSASGPVKSKKED